MLLFCVFACFPGKEPAGESGSLDTGAGDTEDNTEHTGCGDWDQDGYDGCEDCDDGDSGVHPGQTEFCDGVDNDCDELIDEGAGGTYYADNDGDGYGDPGSPEPSCERPDGYVDNGADCDDNDADVNPDGEEIANGEDDNCDGSVDEGLPTVATLTSVTVTWDSTGATVAVSGSASGWAFGMAETGVAEVGWFGESCIAGEEPWGYPDYSYDICHTLRAAGGRIDHVTNIADAADGSTLFTNTIDAAGNITYILLADDASACWTWGDDATYYDDFGCTSP